MTTIARPALAMAGALLLGLTAAGCQTSGMADAGGVPISVEALNGAPTSVSSALRDEISTAAAARQVQLVGASDGARYRVIGYLATETAANGAPAVSFVWDVFSADKRLARRVSGSVPVANAGKLDDLDRAALKRIADESMNGIATVIAAAPESALPQALADGDDKPALGYVAR
jgi:F420-0:gamma-glutamyl ligase-like protein